MQSQTSFVTSPPKNKRGNRNKSPVDEKQKSQDINLSFDERLVSRDDDKVGGMVAKSDTSFFNQDSDQQDSIDRKFREDAISEKQEDDEELKPDKEPQVNVLNQSSWDDDNEAKQEEKKNVSQREMRGNRGNKLSQQKQSCKPQANPSNSQNRSINPDHQLPSQSTAPKRRGNRFPDNESTSDEINNYYRKPRNNQDIPYERGFNSYRGRGNKDYNRQEREYNNYRGGGGRRGGYGNYNQRRDYNNKSDQDKSQSGQNSEKKFQTDKELNESTYKNPNFQKKPRYEERNQYNSNGYGGYSRDYGQKRSEPPQIIQKVVEKQVIKEVQVIVEKFIEPPRPMGIRVHPAVSIFVKGCKIELTCRRLQKFKADLLVIPYKTYKLQLYPGNFVSSLKVNYKEKLKQKGPKLQKQKKLVYMQKCIGSQNFTALGFIKVTNPENDITNGIKQLLQAIKFIDTNNKKKGTQEQKFQSICFPICAQIEAFKAVISTFIQEIEKYSTIVKDVYISTEDPKAFCDAMTKFNEIFVELIQSNDIGFN